MKTAILAALLGSTALIGSAYAQDTNQPPEDVPAAQDDAQTPDMQTDDAQMGDTQTDDAQTGGGTQTPDAADTAPPAGDDAAAAAPGQEQGGFLTWQDQEQMIASNLMGADIWGAENESIGNVDDLLLDREGRVVAVIVGVGGFLGIGQKDVAISTDQLEFVLAQDVQDQQAAPAGTPAQAPATAPAQDTATGGAAAPAPGTVQDPAAPADPAAPPPGTTANPMAPQPGTVPEGQAAPGTAAPGAAPGTAAPMNYTWGWTGAGIEYIQVNFTREQLENAPEFESAE